MWTIPVVFFILLLFVFFDVWYFVRLLPLLPKLLSRYSNVGTRTLSREALLSTSKVEGVVLPSDLDMQLHMNNSKYLREMDFGRFHHFVSTSLYASVISLESTLVVASTMIRYRRSLQLWQRFQLRTRILCWDDSSFYCEQRFVSKQGFVCAIALLKMAVRGRTPKDLLERTCVGGYCQSPPFPPELETWTETIRRSSEALKNE